MAGYNDPGYYFVSSKSNFWLLHLTYWNKNVFSFVSLLFAHENLYLYKKCYQFIHSLVLITSCQNDAWTALCLSSLLLSWRIRQTPGQGSKIHPWRSSKWWVHRYDPGEPPQIDHGERSGPNGSSWSGDWLQWHHSWHHLAWNCVGRNIKLLFLQNIFHLEINFSWEKASFGAFLQ